MKVLNVGDNVLFGHRFNGHDLSNYLRQRGSEANHLVWWKNYDDEHTTEISNTWPDKLYLRDFFTELNIRYSSNALFYPFYYDLLFDPKFLDCDIVHLHLLHNSFFGLEFLPLISFLKPVVWTLHDPWALAGHCVHPLDCNRWLTGCGDCPALDRSFGIRQDASALNWEYKRLMIQASDLDVVVASQWMYDRVSQSPIFEKANLHLVSFGLDLEQFRQQNTQEAAKKKFGIPKRNLVVSFRGSSWVYKGMNYVKECLQQLSIKQPITLMVFQEKGLVEELKDRFQLVELGWIDDDRAMVDAYEASDIFLMPSIAESFGMMGIEAMACGKPVIAMSGTALAEVLRPDESGCVVVPQGDVDAMRAHLETLLTDCNLRKQIGERSRAVAERYYNKDRYVSELMAIYEQVIQRKCGNARAQYLIEQQKRITLPRFEIPLIREKTIKAEKVVLAPAPHSGLTDKENRFLKFLRRVRSLPLIHFAYSNVGKPIIRFARSLWSITRR